MCLRSQRMRLGLVCASRRVSLSRTLSGSQTLWCPVWVPLDLRSALPWSWQIQALGAHGWLLHPLSNTRPNSGKRTAPPTSRNCGRLPGNTCCSALAPRRRLGPSVRLPLALQPCAALALRYFTPWAAVPGANGGLIAEQSCALAVPLGQTWRVPGPSRTPAVTGSKY